MRSISPEEYFRQTKHLIVRDGKLYEKLPDENGDYIWWLNVKTEVGGHTWVKVRDVSLVSALEEDLKARLDKLAGR